MSSTTTTVLPFQPATMSTAQPTAVSYLARFWGHPHVLYAYPLRAWLVGGASNVVAPLGGSSAPMSSSTSGGSGIVA